MRRPSSHFRATLAMSVFVVPLMFPSFAYADLFGDLNQAVDLLKKASGVLPGANKSPPAHVQPSPKEKTTSPAPANDLTLIFSRPESYFQRPRYFDSLGFDVGDYIVVEPLDKESFNALYVPSYKGLPRLSLTPQYKDLKIDYSAGGSKIQTYRKAVAERFHNDMLIYHNLRLLDIMSRYVTEKNLKVDRSGKAQNSYKFLRHLFVLRAKTRPSDQYSYKYIPRYHIESLVSTLRPATHQRYLGDPDDSRSSRIFSRQMFSWGGNKNNDEFKSRRAYFKFIETEVPKLKAWAKSLPRESYIVGTVELGEYDFKRKGFVLTLFAPRGMTSKRIFFYAPRDSSKQLFGATHHIFFPIGEREAEALMEHTKDPHGRPSRLYFAVKGEVYGPQYAGSDSSRHGPTYAGVHLAYDVTGSVIEFFTDELLKNRVYQAQIH